LTVLPASTILTVLTIQIVFIRPFSMSHSPSWPDAALSDSLSDALLHFPLHASIYAVPKVCGTWRLNPSGHHQAGFHLLSAGQCWLHQRDAPAVWLEAGDLVFVSRDCWHVFSPEPVLTDDWTLIPDDQQGPAVELICGAVEFPGGTGQALLAGLPPLVVIAGQTEGAQQRVHALGKLMSLESLNEEPGGRVILDRLADVLVVMVLRYLMASGQAREGMLAALADPHLGKALACIHRDFQQPWTLESLASASGLSRSAFARRFQQTIGETPVNYLTAWKMQQAEHLLRERRHSVAQVGAMLGYQTDAAFRRAFKRLRGYGPGEVRRLSRGDAKV
jgi:AraC family transcriptional regulator, activator of mtrCDE